MRDPACAKVLPDRQKISAWRWAKTWYKFYWDDADAALKRPVTFAVTVPAGHDSVTVAIDDANGVRVRNLLEGADLVTIGGKRSSAKPLNKPTAVFRCTATGYVLKARLPCDRIGLGAAGPGAKVLGDVGVIFSTASGRGVQSRAHLHDHSPGATIVSDTPNESDIRPGQWGAWVME